MSRLGLWLPTWRYVLALLSIFVNSVAWAALPGPILVPTTEINNAHTAWIMTASALVLLMTLPGIALFYSGMVRKKSVINTMANTVVIAALVSIIWFAGGYSLAFTPGDSLIGGTSRFWFSGFEYLHTTKQITVSHIAPNIPETVFAMFQLTFAIITPALIVGAFVERMKFSSVIWFIALWTIFVYVPIAHWVWEPGGWLAQRGVLDFAGGTVVHINAGISGLICAWLVGPRQGYGRESFEPYNLGLTMLGTGLLWIGWFGFNAGSALAADGRAGLAMLVTHISAASGALTWMLGEWMLRRNPSLLGLCSGTIAGLVAITPAAGFVTPGSAVIIGAIAGLVCYWGATGLKRFIGVDDSLDVFGIHGIGGIVGALAVGVFANSNISGMSGNIVSQSIASLAVLIYSGMVTAIILWFLDMAMGLRIDDVSEQTGLDITQHRERIHS